MAKAPAPAAAATAGAAPLSQAQIDRGRTAGIPALLELLKLYPSDARIMQALALTCIAQSNGLEALRWQAKALALNESSVYDGLRGTNHLFLRELSAQYSIETIR